jgi:hypothetical protein
METHTKKTQQMKKSWQKTTMYDFESYYRAIVIEIADIGEK